MPSKTHKKGVLSVNAIWWVFYNDKRRLVSFQRSLKIENAEKRNNFVRE